MSFGKNPYVTKAQAAEQRAADAPDEASRLRALRDAAHQWDRAAEREKPGKQRTDYEAAAERNRSLADGGGDGVGDGDEDDAPPSPSVDAKLLN